MDGDTLMVAVELDRGLANDSAMAGAPFFAEPTPASNPSAFFEAPLLAPLDPPRLKNRCMEMKTMLTPMTKLRVSLCPNRAALIRPVRMVAMVDEYFLRMVSANLKKKLLRMPCRALLTTSARVTELNPLKMLLPALPPAKSR